MIKKTKSSGSSVTEKGLTASLRSEGLDSTGIKVYAYKSTNSTNALAMEWGESGGGEALFVAESQTAGRGRLGRSFLSPEGGLYMSLLLKPESELADFASVTARCAVAVCHALEALTPIRAEIKWVNDVYVDGRKLAGILTQGRVSETGKVEFAVIGIGINLVACDLGDEVGSIAISTEEATGVTPDRCQLAAKIVKEIYGVLSGDDSAVLEEYRHRSILTGRVVRVITADGEYTAEVLGVDEDYRLLLDKSGENVALSTGEVSVRAVDNKE